METLDNVVIDKEFAVQIKEERNAKEIQRPESDRLAYEYIEKPIYDVLKRIFDVVLAGLGLIVLMPLMIIIAIIIVLDDPDGGAIYSHMRSGRNNRYFRFYKFRSMVVNASELEKQLLKHNEMDGPAFKIKDDPRITRIGKFIRKTSIDELPQLWNIIKGDMSIVGPRPLPVHQMEACNDYQQKRLDVLPGLTCYWQCSGRSNLTFDEWVCLDLRYIMERSLWTDFKIILKTIPAVIKMTGAH